MINNNIIKALRILNRKLKNRSINWVIAGSTNLAIQGVDIEPHDIDIVTDKKGAFSIGKILKEFEKEPVEFKESNKFKSYFGIYEIKGVKVEIMGDLEVNKKNIWIRTNGLSKKKIVSFKRMQIPVKSLKSEYESYNKLGRIEKAIKIKKIRMLSKEKIVSTFQSQTRILCYQKQIFLFLQTLRQSQGVCRKLFCCPWLLLLLSQISQVLLADTILFCPRPANPFFSSCPEQRESARAQAIVLST